MGRSRPWTQQADTNAPVVWNYGYDPANQLLHATLKSTGIGASILKQFVYRYDPAGNRLSEQIDSSVSKYTHNSVNQLQTEEGGGGFRFHGSINEPASLKINNQNVPVATNGLFTAEVDVQVGTNTIPFVATDYSGNARTNLYQLVVTNSAIERTFEYDLNGNMIRAVSATSTNVYEWDAANRLVAIDISEAGQPLRRSEFTYDGNGRRIRIVEHEDAVITSDKRLLWNGTELVEERSTTGSETIKGFFVQGLHEPGRNLYFSRDHLHSIREVSNDDEGLSVPMLTIRTGKCNEHTAVRKWSVPLQDTINISKAGWP
jgi:YD repeat-containing protein